MPCMNKKKQLQAEKILQSHNLETQFSESVALYNNQQVVANNVYS